MTGELADKIIEELRTKPEISLSVWADPNNGQIESLGRGRIELNKLANARHIDKSMTDQNTREQIQFQTRVLFEKMRLNTAFHERSKSTVEVQVWFQKELPSEVDLGNIQPSSVDIYPKELEEKLKG